MTRSSLRLLAFVALSATASCGPSARDTDAPSEACPSTTPRVEPGAARAPVVLVVLDGARWQDIFGAPALTPVLHRLAADQGAFVGAEAAVPIAASGPNFVSLPGYMEMLTSAPVSDTCRDNSCPRTSVPTFLDRSADAGLTVAAFGSWARLERAVTNRPGHFLVSTGKDAGAYRPDVETAEAALDHLTNAKPDVLFVSLGDTDENAHRGDVDAYRRSLARGDTFVGDVVRLREGAHVFVTADHGRADDFTDHGGEWPESARSWLLATGPRIRARGMAMSPRARRLADIGVTISALLDLEAPAPMCGGDVLGELF